MTEAARLPGTGWYVVAGAIALATTVAAIATGVWLFLEYEAATPFLAPGRQALDLRKPGSYLVWNDYRTVYQGRSYDESRHLPSGARISVTERASGRKLPVDAHSGTTFTSGSSESVAVAQFNIVQPGAYEVVVEGNFSPRVMSVGRSFIFLLAGGIFGAFALLFMGYGAAIAIAGWAFLKREEAAQSAVPARTPAAGPTTSAPAREPTEKSLKQLTAIIYGLQIAAFLVGITFIAGVIVNYLKRKDVEGTWLESHFRWQIRTFWYGLLWTLVGCVLVFVLIGFLVLMGAAAWVLYRAIRGWIQLEDGKPMYTG